MTSTSDVFIAKAPLKYRQIYTYKYIKQAYHNSNLFFNRTNINKLWRKSKVKYVYPLFCLSPLHYRHANKHSKWITARGLTVPFRYLASLLVHLVSRSCLTTLLFTGVLAFKNSRSFIPSHVYPFIHSIQQMEGRMRPFRLFNYPEIESR